MAWPNSPLRTYVANTTPAIDAGDLNKIQIGINDLYGSMVGTSRALFSDDFLYAGTEDGDGGGIGNLNWTFLATRGRATTNVLAAAEGDHGTISFRQRTVGDSSGQLVGGGSLGIAQGDFWLAGRVKTLLPANFQTFQLGGGDGGGHSVYLYFAAADANWQVRTNGTSHNTGVAVVADTWITFELTRIAGTLNAYINGNLVYGPVAYNSSILSYIPDITYNLAVGGLADTTIHSSVDYYKILAVRI